jgi:hypothetical protein
MIPPPLPEIPEIVLFLPELLGLHPAEHTFTRVVRLLQGSHKPSQCAVHMLHRRIGDGETAFKAREMVLELRKGPHNGVRWKGR